MCEKTATRRPVDEAAWLPLIARPTSPISSPQGSDCSAQRGNVGVMSAADALDNDGATRYQAKRHATGEGRGA
jgi:hypothetical protein